MNWARIARILSSTTQVLTAAAAVTLGVASSSMTAITALSASSAVMPELQNIFEARERAIAYSQGVDLIEKAEGRYFLAIASRDNDEKSSKGLVSKKKLGIDGANLYIEIMASLRLVEKALVSMLPTIEEMETATGKVTERIRGMDIIPSGKTSEEPDLELEIGQESNFVIISGGPATSAVSNKPRIAEVTKMIENVINVKGLANGEAVITVTNGHGSKSTRDVTVGDFSKSFWEIVNGVTINGTEITKDTKEPIYINNGVNYIKVKPISEEITVISENRAIIDIFDENKETIKLRATKGNTTLTFTNRRGDKISKDVEVIVPVSIKMAFPPGIKKMIFCRPHDIKSAIITHLQSKDLKTIEHTVKGDQIVKVRYLEKKLFDMSSEKLVKIIPNNPGNGTITFQNASKARVKLEIEVKKYIDDHSKCRKIYDERERKSFQKVLRKIKK